MLAPSLGYVFGCLILAVDWLSSEMPAFPNAFNGTVIVNSSIPGQGTEFPESTQADAGMLEEDDTSFSGSVVEFPVRMWAHSRYLQEAGDDEEAEQHEEAEEEPNLILYLILYLIPYLVLTAAVMCCYQSGITNKRSKSFQPDPGYAIADADFRFTTFDCFGDCTACLYGCCCFESRLGDNMAATGTLGYWPAGGSALAVFVVYQTLGVLIDESELVLGEVETGGVDLSFTAHLLAFYITHAFYAFWLAGKVQIMRKTLGDSKPEAKKMSDCICLCFCGCCEIIKHGRHIDAATGVKTECPCKLVTTYAAPVGTPVQVQSAPLVQATVIQGQPVHQMP